MLQGEVVDVVNVLSLGSITQTSQHTTLCIYRILVQLKLIHTWDASSYTICSPRYEGLALGALNARTHRLNCLICKEGWFRGCAESLDKYRLLAIWSEPAWRRVKLHPMLTILRVTGSRRAEGLDTPLA